MRLLSPLLFPKIAAFSRQPRIAIVGAGPAGLFVCAGILRRLNQCQIDIFDRNPVPFGLVRYGVAPDHPEVKNCINLFDKMFAANGDRLNLFCNVSVGTSVKYRELCSDYDAVVLAYGARRPKRLDIPGISADNVFSGMDFVSWYNAFPGARTPLFNCENAIIIGNGNVALDCSRIILSAKSHRLRFTDIPPEILDVIEDSKIKIVTICGRRGPLEAKFTIKELREHTVLPGCSFEIFADKEDVSLMRNSLDKLSRPKKRIVELLLKNMDSVKGTECDVNRCHLIFRRTPAEVLSNSEGRVRAVRFRHSLSGEESILPCGLFIYSIGYENFVLDGVPKDEDGQIRLKDDMRVDNPSHYADALVYACGWCAHVPRGVIADTQIDASKVAARLCNDLIDKGTSRPLESNTIARLRLRNLTYRTWDDWKKIDDEEKRRGASKGKPREKLLDQSYLSNAVW